VSEIEPQSVNLDTDDADSLRRLPGIGPTIAQRIVEARPFADLDDVRRVKGVGAAILDRLRSFVTVGSQGDGEEEESAPEGEALVAKVADPTLSVQWEATEREEEAMDDEQENALTQPVSAQALEDERPDQERQEEGATEAEIAGVSGDVGRTADAQEPAAEGEPASAEELVDEYDFGVAEAADEYDVDAEEIAGAKEVDDKDTGAAAALTEGAEGFPEEEGDDDQEALVPLVPRSRVSRRYVLSVAGLVGVVALVLGVLLSLGIVATLNGGQLQFVTPAQLSALDVRVGGLEESTRGLSEDVAGLRTRLNNLEALGGRVDAAEQNVEQLRADVDSAATDLEGIAGDVQDLETHVAGLDQRLDGLSADVSELQTERDRFQAFLDGLQALMDSLYAPAGGE
jgi:hypothetical protein